MGKEGVKTLLMSQPVTSQFKNSDLNAQIYTSNAHVEQWNDGKYGWQHPATILDLYVCPKLQLLGFLKFFP